MIRILPCGILTLPHGILNAFYFGIMNVSNLLKISICFYFVFINIAYCNLRDYFFESSIYNLERIENDLKNDKHDTFYLLGKGCDYILLNIFKQHTKNSFNDIELYNKAWYAKRNFDYNNARKWLLNALQSTENLWLKRAIRMDLTVVESMLGYSVQELRKNKRMLICDCEKESAS